MPIWCVRHCAALLALSTYASTLLVVPSTPPRSKVLRPPVESAQYASRACRKLAASWGMTVSMSRRANAWDNAPMESFFKTLKVERIYQTRYETRAQARLDSVDWIEGYYNRRPIHSSTGYRTPVQAEETLMAASHAVRGTEAGSGSDAHRTAARSPSGSYFPSAPPLPLWP